MSDLENRLRAAIEGIPNPYDAPEGAPVALNDDDSLRSIILGEIHSSFEKDAEEITSREQHAALMKVINPSNQRLTSDFTFAVNNLIEEKGL